MSHALIDWVSFTLRPDLSLPDVTSLLDLPLHRLGTAKPIGGYRHGYRYGHVLLCCDGRENSSRGVHVQLCGKACRQLENDGAITSWPLSICSWRELGASLSRLDVALDDHSGLLDIHEIAECARTRQYTGKARKWRIHESGDKSIPRTSLSVCFGSPSSARKLIIYDKASQEGRAEAWVRAEVQLRNAYADEIAHLLAWRGEDVVRDILPDLIRFRWKTNDSRPERWPERSWWPEFADSRA